jgi:hypothetical protein
MPQGIVRHSINEDSESFIKIEEEDDKDIINIKRREDTFKKPKTDQMKIPIMFGGNSH